MRGSAARGVPIAALLCAAVAAGLLVLGGGSSRYTVTAEFSDVRGLVEGGQVRLAGVPVGEVSRIELGADGNPRVSLSLDDDVKLRTGARAAVRMASLSGEFNDYVSIVQGAGEPLARGAGIPLAHTTSPVQVDSAIATFDPATRTALKTALAGLRRTLAGQGTLLAATLRRSGAALREVAALADDVGSDGAALSAILAGGHTIAATLAARTPQMTAALTGTNALLATIASRAGALAQGLASLPGGLRDTRLALSQGDALLAPADRLVVQAAPAVSQLEATSRELRGALTEAGPALSAAEQVLTQAPPAARAAMPLLHAVPPRSALVASVLQRLGPMLDQLRVRLPDAFSFFSNWADFTSNYDANGHGARVGIVLPPAPTSVLSPASDGPGQLRPPYLRTPGAMNGQPWVDYWKSFVAGGTP